MDNTFNPYDFANPVSTAELLAGREKEMDEIKYYLDNAKNAPRPINFALLGQRASGKTSILNITEYEAKKRGFCTVRINLDEDDARTQLGFFSKVFDSIFSEVCNAGAFGGVAGNTYDTYLDMIHAYAVPQDKTFCPFLFPIQYAKAMSSGHADAPVSDHSLMKDLRRISEELKQPIILLFDEGNVLAQSRVLLQKLRNSFMNIPGYMLVITGTPDFFPAMDEVFSPISRQFKKINVSEFIDVDDTLDCIQRPLKEQGSIAQEIFDFENVSDIHNLSGGRPYEIQLICHILFRRVESKRAESMKLDYSVLEEVRRELEKWQDITSRPILTNVLNLSKRQIEALGILCSCNGKATFEQIWEFEYIFEGASSRTRDSLEKMFQTFVNRGILKINDGLISFAGDDFDKIYAKYFAREQNVTLNFSSTSLDISWKDRLNHFINTYLKDRLEAFVSRSTQLSFKGGDILDFIQEIASNNSERDYFVDLAPIPQYVYTIMVQLQDQSTIPVIIINPQLPWLKVQLAYRSTKPTDVYALEEGLSQIQPLCERVAELGGNFILEKKDIPVIPQSLLVDKVLQTANVNARLSLSRYHTREMFTDYNDPLSREKAFLHADLSYRYRPEPSFNDSNNIGYVFLGADDLDRAEVLFNRAINLCQSENLKVQVHPIFPALPIYNRGVLYAEQGQIESALTDFRTCIDFVQSLDLEQRSVSWLWVPIWNNGDLIFEERSSPDLLVAAELAKIAIESIMRGSQLIRV